MAKISTHVLDLAQGKPAAGIEVTLVHAEAPHVPHTRATARTNADGRTDAPLLLLDALPPGAWDLTFHVGDYFRAQGIQAFYEKITIAFLVTDSLASYHVPLLLAPHAYSTYRGS